VADQEMLLAQTIFVCSIILISSFVYIFMSTPQKQSFFQVWVIGPNGAILEPVLAISSNQSYLISVGVQNTMRHIEYCRLTTKFQSAPLSNVSTTSVELEDFRFFLLDNETWARNISFEIDSTAEDAMIRIHGIKLDGSYFMFNLTSAFDSDLNGFFWQFRFDLWAFNTSSFDFYSTNIWASSPFLNMTQ